MHTVVLEGCTVDLSTRRVERGPEANHLTELETRLLGYMVAHPRRDLARDELVDAVWGVQVVPRAVDISMRRLRMKIEQDHSTPRHVLSVRGVGYRFEPRVRQQGPQLIGREREIREVLAQFGAGARLVTIHGPGGAGKTSLARAILARVPGRFIPLSECRTVGEARQQVAASLGIMGPLDSALAGQNQLLVLDNVEQVPLARQVQEWLAVASDLRLLVTTRQPLGLEEEVVEHLNPLAVHDAVALFRHHAGPDGDDSVVQAIVERLDCLPLAIELAAARALVLSPAGILKRLDQRFRLLSGPDRERTLYETIVWSWDLLTAEEQGVLAQMSVFRGGFEADAAEGVLVAEHWVLDCVESLVQKALVVRVFDGDVRFALFESIQVFAAEKLQDQGSVYQRHARHYLTLDGAPLPRLVAEQSNLTIIVERLPGAMAAQGLLAVGPVFLHRGPFCTLIPRIEACLRVGFDPELLLLRGELHRRSGAPLEAMADFSLALADSHGVLRGRILGAMANVHRVRGDLDAAEACVQEAFALLEASPKPLGVLCGAAGAIAKARGDLEGAASWYRRGLTLHQQTGNVAYEGTALTLLGNVLHRLGRLEEAKRHHTEALAVHRRTGARWLECTVLTNLGNVCQTMGDLEDAARLQRESIEVAQEVGDPRSEAIARANLGSVLREQGELGLARAALEQAEVMHRAMGSLRSLQAVRRELALIGD